MLFRGKLYNETVRKCLPRKSLEGCRWYSGGHSEYRTERKRFFYVSDVVAPAKGHADGGCAFWMNCRWQSGLGTQSFQYQIRVVAAVRHTRLLSSKGVRS